MSNCVQPVLDRLPEIWSAIRKACAECGVNEIFDLYLWKSRAAGTCRPDSDIDLYVQISNIDRSIDLDDLDLLNRILRNLGLSHIRGLELDARFGVGLPGQPPCLPLEKTL